MVGCGAAQRIEPWDQPAAGKGGWDRNLQRGAFLTAGEPRYRLHESIERVGQAASLRSLRITTIGSELGEGIGN